MFPKQSNSLATMAIEQHGVPVRFTNDRVFRKPSNREGSERVTRAKEVEGIIKVSHAKITSYRLVRIGFAPP